MPTTVADVPSDLQVDFDVYDPAHTIPVDRMQEHAAELAAKGPLVWSTAYGGHWIVTRYDAVQAVMRDPETFSSYPNNLVDAAQGKFLPLELDPPEHTAFRQALQPLFSPKRMRMLEVEIRRIVTELIDAIGPKGRSEYVADFAHELPTRVFLALMGWPAQDAPMFTEATEIVLNGRPGDTPEQANQSRAEAAMQMFGYFGKAVAERRAAMERGDAPAEDVTAEIMSQQLTIDGDERPMTDEELVRSLFLLLIAGLHTVQGSLAWGLIHLARHPEQRRKLIDDPELLPGAVEEILRFEAAVAPGRRARKDAEVEGITVREGDQMLIMLCSANRDAAQFEAPDELRIDRTPNRHITFGSGPHRCLGSHLGRIELKIAFEELHKRIPDYALDPDEAPLVLPSQVRSVQRLPIVFTPITVG